MIALRSLIWKPLSLIQVGISSSIPVSRATFRLHVPLQKSFSVLSSIRTSTTTSLPLPLTAKKSKKRKRDSEALVQPNHFQVFGLALGGSINLTAIEQAVCQQTSIADTSNYEMIALPEDFSEGLALTPKQKSADEPTDIFVFRNGTVVLWNAHQKEVRNIRQFLSGALTDPYEKTDTEMFHYRHVDQTSSNLDGEMILLRQGMDRDQRLLEKYSYSDAIGLSVKLGVLETQFFDVASDIEPWIARLKSGGSLWGLSETRVLKLTGELFTLRHLINVQTDLTNTPDAYWENPNLEQLFSVMSRSLTLRERCNDLNEKLDLCCEFMNLLSGHLHAQRSTRLEIMIIVLISVEVVFQFYHFFKGS